MTKQAEDDKTPDFFDTGKRGPGRQKTGKAMTEAQRSKRYRANRKAQPEKPYPGPPSYGMLESRIMLLNAENMGLSNALQAAREKIAALERLLRKLEG
jgi:hypothetical protein